MPAAKPPIVISLGGSLVVPEEIEVGFLKSFKKLIEQQLALGQRFILIIGGGRTARRYQHAARKISTLTPVDLDWLGIHATRLNAHLLRTIFRKDAHPQIITDRKKINPKIRAAIIIAAGFKPGSSTDYDAVLLAKAYQAKTILNLSNVDWVYDADPRINKKAKPIERMTWKTLVKLVGTRWDPGAHVPFDPVASKWAAKWGMRVIITRGNDLANLKRHFFGKTARGTVIAS